MPEEKIYNINLGEAYKKTRIKRTPYAVRLIKNYLKKHTKREEIKIGRKLNEELWKRGIKKPPRKIRIKAVIDGNIVKAELIGFEYEEFKAKPKTEKKGMREKLIERLGPKAIKKEYEEKKIEGKNETKEEPEINK